MKMVSMANKPKKEDEKGMVECCDDAKYPYGTQISLCNDHLEALGITEMPKIGTTVVLTAHAKVVFCRSEEDQDGSTEQSLSLQITDLGIDSKMSESKKAGILYGSENKETTA